MYGAVANPQKVLTCLWRKLKCPAHGLFAILKGAFFSFITIFIHWVSLSICKLAQKFEVLFVTLKNHLQVLTGKSCKQVKYVSNAKGLCSLLAATTVKVQLLAKPVEGGGA